MARPGLDGPSSRRRSGTGSVPSTYYVLSSEEFTTSQLIQYGIEAERVGFDGVWTSDHFQPWQANESHSAPAWVTLAALTQRTSRVTMGTGVTCPSFRYRPAIVAQVWAALSALAPDRLFLGLGTGEKLNEGAAGGGWGTYKERAERLVEAVRIIRSLWTGNHVRIRGKYWDVDAKLYDPPASSIPIYIAAGGKESARLAGLHGDGMITGAATLKYDPKVKSIWRRALKEAGKDPSSAPLVVEHWAFVGNEKDAREAAKRWRFLPKAWEHGYYDNASPVQIQRLADKEIGLDEVVKDWTVGEDAKVHVEDIRKLVERGATHIAIHVSSSSQIEVIDFFGREVLPRLQMTTKVPRGGS